MTIITSVHFSTAVATSLIHLETHFDKQNHQVNRSLFLSLPLICSCLAVITVCCRTARTAGRLTVEDLILGIIADLLLTLSVAPQLSLHRELALAVPLECTTQSLASSPRCVWYCSWLNKSPQTGALI